MDLSNIIKDLSITNKDDQAVLGNVIEELDNFSKYPSPNKNEIIIALNVLRTECEKDIPHKVLAGSKNAFNIIVALMLSQETNTEVILECLKTMIALMSGQPDLLNNNGIGVMMKFLETQMEPEIQSLLLKWIRECCIKHEMNRYIK